MTKAMKRSMMRHIRIIYHGTVLLLLLLLLRHRHRLRLSSFSPVLLFFFCRFVIVKWQCCSSENDLHVRENMLVAERTQNSTSHSPFDRVYHQRDSYTPYRTKRNCVAVYFVFSSSLFLPTTIIIVEYVFY